MRKNIFVDTSPLTEKEIVGVGYRRYLFSIRKIRIASVIIFILLSLAVAFLSRWINDWIAVGLEILIFVSLVVITIRYNKNAELYGKTLLEAWNDENES